MELPLGLPLAWWAGGRDVDPYRTQMPETLGTNAQSANLTALNLKRIERGMDNQSGSAANLRAATKSLRESVERARQFVRDADAALWQQQSAGHAAASEGSGNR